MGSFSPLMQAEAAPITLGRQMSNIARKLDLSGARFTEALSLMSLALTHKNSTCFISKCDLFGVNNSVFCRGSDFH